MNNIKLSHILYRAAIIAAALLVARCMTGCAANSDGLLPQSYTANGVPRVRVQDAIYWEVAPRQFKACQDGNVVKDCK